MAKNKRTYRENSDELIVDVSQTWHTMDHGNSEIQRFCSTSHLSLHLLRVHGSSFKQKWSWSLFVSRMSDYLF